MIFSLKLNKPLLAYHRRDSEPFFLDIECDRIDVLAIIPSYVKAGKAAEFDHKAGKYVTRDVQRTVHTYVCRCSGIDAPMLLEESLEDLMCEEFYVFANTPNATLVKRVKQLEKARAEYAKEKAKAKKTTKRKAK